MPGIAGIIGKGNSDINAGPVARMVKAMMHERFYTSGSYSNEQQGVWVGWTSHPKSFAEELPIWNARRDICLIFAGEDFPDPSETKRLSKQGLRLSPGNAEYLVHNYEEQGTRFLSTLNGWFSGVLVDLRKNEVTLFNDRYGLRRLYIHETEDALYFASEAKCLLSVLPGTRRFDPTGLSEYLACGCALRDRTIFAGMSLLPPGSAWKFRNGELAQKGSHFQKSAWENQAPMDAESYYEALWTTFARILPNYLRADSPMAMSLTGGLDGRMIMAWSGARTGQLPCYTFGGPVRDCIDLKLARKVAAACGQPHRVIKVDGRFLKEFPKLSQRAVFISDGAMNVTGSVELFANAQAREIAPIRLTGNYGSEILRRHVAFRADPLREGVFDPELVRGSAAAAETYAAEAKGHPLSFIAFKQVPWFHHSRLTLELSQLIPRSPYLDNELVGLAFRAPHDFAVSKEPSLRLVNDGNPALGKIPTDGGFLLKPTPVLNPLRRLIQDFTMRAEYAYDWGMPQWLARIDNAFAPLQLEKLFLGRHKFYHFRAWYRGALAGYVKDMLLDPRTRQRPYVRGSSLEGMVLSHTSGRGNYTMEIHKILTLELIERELLERHWE